MWSPLHYDNCIGVLRLIPLVSDCCIKLIINRLPLLSLKSASSGFIGSSIIIAPTKFWIPKRKHFINKFNFFISEIKFNHTYSTYNYSQENQAVPAIQTGNLSTLKKLHRNHLQQSYAIFCWIQKLTQHQKSLKKPHFVTIFWTSLLYYHGPSHPNMKDV